MKLSKGVLATLVIFAVILLDQLLKIWIKTGFYLGEDLQITSFFHLYFIQNPGMAFGMEMGSKLFLSIFRILAVIVWVYYIVMLRNN